MSFLSPQRDKTVRGHHYGVQRMTTFLVSVGISLHFAMILFVVFHLDDRMVKKPAWRPVVSLSSLYSTVTFANRNFGFFAPSVTPDWNLQITAVNDSGHRWRYSLRTPSREMQVKMYSMLGHFAEDNDTMDLFARSWAVHAMNDEPMIIRVDIDVTRNSIPSMSDYRNGKRTRPEPFYSTTFDAK